MIQSFKAKGKGDASTGSSLSPHRVCRTRWVARIDSLGVFIKIYSAIVALLEEISNNVGGTWNVESRMKASGINHAIVTFQFVVCLIIISRCLEVTRPLTKQLQSASFDVGAARAKIDLLYLILDNMRTEIDAKHNVLVQRGYSNI